jgi:hypothetical protein
MRNLGIPDLDGDRCQSSSDNADSVVPAHHGEGLGNGFVERLRRHVELVRGVVQVVDTVQALRATMAIYHIRYLFLSS